jgi:hypothetical protein
MISTALIATPVVAQDNGAVIQQGYAFQRDVAAHHVTNGWNADTLPLTIAHPRYIVEAISMHAVDETGPDFPGADEIIASFQSEGNGMFTGVYGDFDTNETKALRSGQRCMYAAIDPDNQANHNWSCDPNGRTGPIDFIVTLYEYDGEWRNFFSPGFCIGSNDVGYGNCGIRVRSTVVGSYRKFFSEAELAAALPHPGDSFSATLLIDNCSEAVTVRGETCGYSTWLPTYAAYTLNYRVTRVADLVAPAPHTLSVE